MIITIDGPAVSGKSSIAKELAQRLGLYYLQTGLLYRALTYILGNDNIETDGIREILSHLQYTYENGTPKIIYKGTDITPYLTTARIDSKASELSADPIIRHELLEFQRKFGKSHDMVTEGRDCGSVVFPDAEHKFYLTASVAERAQRLVNDAKRKASDLTVQKAQALLEERDRRDSTRSISPLIIPKGGIVIDNTGMTKEQTIEAFLRHIRPD